MDVTRSGDLLPKAPGHFIGSKIFAINLYQCVRSSSQIIPGAKICSIKSWLSIMQHNIHYRLLIVTMTILLTKEFSQKRDVEYAS